MSLDIMLIATVTTAVVSNNITHNLTKMWHEAGVYYALYEMEGLKAKDVLPILKAGLSKMKADPAKYKKFDSPNGWGTYKNAVPWLENLIEEFEKYTDGVIGGGVSK